MKNQRKKQESKHNKNISWKKVYRGDKTLRVTEINSEEEIITNYLKSSHLSYGKVVYYNKWSIDYTWIGTYPGIQKPVSKNEKELRLAYFDPKSRFQKYQRDYNSKFYSNRRFSSGIRFKKGKKFKHNFKRCIFVNCIFTFHVSSYGEHGIIYNKSSFQECKFVNCTFIFKVKDDVEKINRLGCYTFTACIFKKCRISEKSLHFMEIHLNRMSEYTYNIYDDQMIIRKPTENNERDGYRPYPYLEPLSSDYKVEKYNANDLITRTMFHSTEIEMFAYYHRRRSTLYIPQDEGDNIHQQMEHFIKTFYAVYGDEMVENKEFHILSQRQGLYVIKDRQLVKKDIIKMKPKAFWKLLEKDGIEFNVNNIVTARDLAIVEFDGQDIGAWVGLYEWEGLHYDETDEGYYFYDYEEFLEYAIKNKDCGYNHLDDRYGYNITKSGYEEGILPEGFKRLNITDEEHDAFKGVDIVNSYIVYRDGGVVNGQQYLLGENVKSL